MELNNKKLIGIAILALLLSFVALSQAQSLSSFWIKLSGQPQINDNVTISCITLNCTEDAANHTITLNATGIKGDKGDSGVNGTSGYNFTLNTTGQPAISEYATITGSNGNIVTQSGHTIDIAAPSDYDNYEPPIIAGSPNQFWMYNKTWQNISTTWITEGVNLWFTNARAISAVQSILDAMNQSSANNDTASQNRDNTINDTKANKTGDTFTGNVTFQQNILKSGSGYDILGDVDGNGVIDYNDANDISLYIVGLYSPCPLSRCDINGNGVINSADALALLQITGRPGVSNPTVQPYVRLTTQGMAILRQVDINGTTIYPSKMLLNTSVFGSGILTVTQNANGTVTLNPNINKTTYNVEIWTVGTDGKSNFSLNDTLLSNSSEVWINGLSKDLFSDYNETSQSINFSITLNYLDNIKVKYAKK